MATPSGRPARSVAAAALLLAATGSGCGGPAASDNPWTSWSTLRMDARAGPFFTGRVEMRLGPEEGRQVFETSTVARFLGVSVARSSTRSVLDAESGRTLLYLDRSKKRVKRFVFSETGYTVERLTPDGDRDAPLDRWNPSWTAQFDFPEDDEGHPLPVFDYYGMLLQLRRLDLEQRGDEATIYVATSDGPVAYRIIVGEQRTEEIAIRSTADGPSRTLSGRALRLRIRPADPAANDEGFLRMEGETEVWVEASSKTLVEVSGNAPKIPGRLRLRLAAMD